MNRATAPRSPALLVELGGGLVRRAKQTVLEILFFNLQKTGWGGQWGRQWGRRGEGEEEAAADEFGWRR